MPNNFIYRLSIPGKSFLAGEYCALHGGATLVAAIHPRFELRIKSSKNGDEQEIFHGRSPAGKLWQTNKQELVNYSYEFIDPYQGQGGFGASTAQFALLHAWLQHLRSNLQFDLQKVFSDYRLLTADYQHPPSGADLVSQCEGGLTFFEKNRGQLEKKQWLFADLEFLFFKTPFKVKTHEHLAILEKFDSSQLQAIMQKIKNAFSTNMSNEFIEAIRAYAAELTKLQFVSPESKSLQDELMKNSFVLSVKGCGAMGADIICVLCEKRNEVKESIKERALQLKLNFVADSANLSEGIRINFSPSQMAEAMA